jgi:hypothetical protein
MDAHAQAFEPTRARVDGKAERNEMNDIEHDTRLADTVDSLHEAPSPGGFTHADGTGLARRSLDDGEESSVAPGGEADFVGAETTELLKLAAREAIDGLSAPLGVDEGPVLDEPGAARAGAEAPQVTRQLAWVTPPAPDELGGILQDFELRLNGCVDALLGEHDSALEQHYRQELRRARAEAAAEFREREAALRSQLDADYRRKEQTLRSSYRKLVETANRMKQQKAQLQQARQQFEEKLDAVNALHRKVEDMRRQLRDHLGPEAP